MVLWQDAVKIMAKDLVRTRRYVRKFMLMKANIQAVSLKIQTLKSQSSMAQAMRGVTRAMASMNRQLNVPQIQKILQVCKCTCNKSKECLLFLHLYILHQHGISTSF